MNTRHLFQLRPVARQTGLPAHIIRIRKRRYQVAPPQSTFSSRCLYSTADIQRLQFIRGAIQDEPTISGIANLSTAELAELFNRPYARLESRRANA